MTEIDVLNHIMTAIDVLNHNMTEIGVFYPIDLKFLTWIFIMNKNFADLPQFENQEDWF